MRRPSPLHTLHNHNISDLHKMGIYTITSKSNNKIYVGCTTHHFGFIYRWRQHVNSLLKNKHHNKYLQNHVNKHGLEDLQFEILEYCDAQYAYSLERYWIYHLDSINQGFNLIYGNICDNSNRRHKFDLKKEMRICKAYMVKGRSLKYLAKYYKCSTEYIKLLVLRLNNCHKLSDLNSDEGCNLPVLFDIEDLDFTKVDTPADNTVQSVTIEHRSLKRLIEWCNNHPDGQF